MLLYYSATAPIKGKRLSTERFLYFLEHKWKHINTNMGFAVARSRLICQFLGTQWVLSHLIVDLARSQNNYKSESISN